MKLRPLLLLALLWANTIAAAEVRVLYERDATASACPSEEEFSRALSRRVPDLAFSEVASTVVQVELFASEDHFLARLWRTDGGRVAGQREISSEGPSCQRTFDAAVLAVAISLLHDRAAPRSPLRSAAPAAEHSAPPPSSPLRIRLSLGPTGSVATSLRPAVGAQAEVSLLSTNLSVALGGWTEARTLLPVAAGQIRGTVNAGTLSGCYSPASHLALCAVVAAGAFEATAENLPEARTVVRPYVAAGPRAAWELPLTKRLVLIGQAEALLPIVRTGLQVDHLEVWSTPPIGVRASVLLATEVSDGFLGSSQ